MHGLAGRLPNESLAQYILGGAVFPHHDWPRRGYDMREVDQHLDRLREWALTGQTYQLDRIRIGTGPLLKFSAAPRPSRGACPGGGMVDALA